MPIWHLFYFVCFYVSKPERHGRHTEGYNSLHNVTLGGYNLSKIVRDTILYNRNTDHGADNYNWPLAR
jgi:hypothetical protein